MGRLSFSDKCLQIDIQDQGRAHMGKKWQCGNFLYEVPKTLSTLKKQSILGKPSNEKNGNSLVFCQREGTP